MLTRARSLGRHRGKTPAQLRADLDQATCELVGLATEIDDLKAARSHLEGQLDEAGIDLSGAREDLALAREEIRQLEEAVELRDQTIADLERKVDVGVKAEHVIARTQEIPVITRVMPLHESPMAVADPGRVPPSWAGLDEPEPAV
jgi:chromosome segregation ATPase